MAGTWAKQLETLLIQEHGPKKGMILAKKYAHAFSLSYNDEYNTNIAVHDIDKIEELSSEHPLEMNLYIAPGKTDSPLHLRLYQWQQNISLSDILPMLENLGLRTNSERSSKITLDKDEEIWISDFIVVYTQDMPFDIDNVNQLFEDAFNSIYFGKVENDGFNKLTLGASLSWREVQILRTYAKYLHQIRFRFSQPYIEAALIKHTSITNQLIALFKVLHDPSKNKKMGVINKTAAQIEAQILQSLEAVTSLDEDRIIRRMLDLIKATLRTNYFQKDTQSDYKPYLSIKLDSHRIPEMPLPIPLYEIFVYSPRFEAIHLRNTRVARGGIRWSDRREDFRTEILGLMKAQVVKNSVIVPSGSKGGFVLKTPPTLTPTRESLMAEVITCYKAFISGLLDITDNIVEKDFVPPKDVVCYDTPDPYLVVAADKGTATFSDIANAISQHYKFWLDDAFASGGSTGYDHKEMGITAKGAWESIKRHFRELNIDIKKHDITVVGIGDMSGDVFGNGMLYSKHIKLVAAFDNRHIFIDPDPKTAESYRERQRLFKLPTSSWEDFNPALISKGGGVFRRSVKSITITPQMKAVLGIEEKTLAPNDLIRAILKSPVDLLFNGGIGTYVKSSTEHQADVGDRTNDYCRINGDELRCLVVGEGGNLGFTQLGRIEYALNGGLINTDFIDNSAGVDCSDHEVNVKILLDQEVHRGNLTVKKRNDLLATLTNEVAELVLTDNYNQALVMSYSAANAIKNIALHANYIKDLETTGILDRAVEFLPTDKELLERKTNNIGLTRPELAVLLAYTKINIKLEILKTNIPDDAYFKNIIQTAFPPSIRKKYQAAMVDHRLQRDIVATQLSNQFVNEMGITFAYRLQIETGSSIEEIIRAHAVASHIFDTHELQKLVESLDFKIPASEQFEMLFNIRNLINLATRWFLHGNHLNDKLEVIIEHYNTHIKILESHIPNLMAGSTKEYLDKLVERFLQAGLSREIAQRIASYRAIYTALNIILVATDNKFDLLKTARVYFAAGERVNLLWFRDQISSDTREGHWNTLARVTLRDELDISQRALTVAIINNNKKETNELKLINKWVRDNQRAIDRWENLLTMLNASSNLDYAMFFIAIRELLGLILNSKGAV
ncbi:MAG: NAD-glutamate dehydrogenase domain-containing protein [Gammaproteobacteria bacterium]